MYKKILIFVCSTVALALVLSILPIHGENEIYDCVLRLHVIANSDSEEDQELKLSVRDAVLEETSDIFTDCKSKIDAESAARKNLGLIQDIAERTIKNYGFDYTVSVELGNEEYPTKNYETCCFPSGEYLSLRINIGQAKGQNWWCVMFPPLCLGAASDSDNAFIQAGLSEEQYNIITQTDKAKYKIRFKILEAFS